VKLTREITVTPAYDCVRVKPCVHGSEACSTIPGRNHGIHYAEMRMHLGTEDHEVVLTVNTGWYLPQTPNRFDHSADRMGSSVGCHSRHDIPTEETRIMSDPKNCPRGWELCYSAMSYSLTASEGALLLVTEGTDAAWAWLEELYNDRFEG
jgi:hypothetical protein